LSAALQAFLHDTTYAQVHTVAFTGGEIRAQILLDQDEEEDSDHGDRRR
jgi:hypothetical protein